MRVAIIGASFAGVAAALEVRKKFKQAEIILLEKQSKLGYIPNGLHLYLDKKIASLEEASFITEEQLQQQRIQIHLSSEVERVDVAQKQVSYQSPAGEDTLVYDKLIIATGSSQLSQKISGCDTTRVLKYKRFHEAEDALEKLNNSQQVTIIGGGQIGVEAADLLQKNGKQVTLIENMDYVLFKYFDKEMIEPLQAEMEKSGVTLHLNQTVSSVEETDETVVAHLLNESIVSDTAILAVNVRPDLRFLGDQIKLHTDHTIVVDRYLRTSEKDVFAVGDCIQLQFGVDKDTFYIPLINNAIRTGMVAAANLVEPILPFKGSLRTIGTSAFDYYIASTGMTEEESLFYTHPVSAVRQKIKLSSLPTAETATVKFIYDKESRVLLGAQLLSKANILDKINTLALAIQTNQTLEDLMQKDFFFHPVYTNLIETTNLVTWPDVRWGAYED
ncbi:FAD-dependent oxidoreductase [Desemzia sp. RIT804]|uniref:FAD-dependent oxidoreductase n=1 Tax=Desemzia sp. RIT 804 TaxID=2810209 RepID=UPI00194DBE8C|nr:FAD-dependent oxidoreductase [Desemzia sp. RIT 804]MBM6615381.1 FAD-dependent oxidoreductase [Desemzia sp. RIT 804]